MIVFLMLTSFVNAADDFGPSIRDIRQAVDAYVDGARPERSVEKRNRAEDLVAAVIRLRTRSSGPNLDALLWAFGRLTAHALGRSAAAAARDRLSWPWDEAHVNPDLYHPDLRVLLAPAGRDRPAAVALLEDMSRAHLDDEVRVRAAQVLDVIYGALFVIAMGDGTPEDRVLPGVNRVRVNAIAILAGGTAQATSLVRQLLRLHEDGANGSPLIKAAATQGLLRLVWQKHPDEVARACLDILDDSPRRTTAHLR